MWKIKITLFILLFSSWLFLPFQNIVNSQSNEATDNGLNAVQQKTTYQDSYYLAKVVEILEAGKKNIDGYLQDYQKLKLEIINSDEKGKQIVIDHGSSFVITSGQKVVPNEMVVIAKTPPAPGAKSGFYYIIDKYRVNRLIYIILVFLLAVIYFGRRRGFTSMVGMLFSVAVIFYYIIPSILKGSDPLLTCIIGSVVIILLSLYLSHGFNRRTSIALLSTLLSFGLAIVIDLFFVYITKLSGNGTEEAFYLQFDGVNLDLRKLLLGSIIIGVLGVLDDVTTGQSAAIEEVAKANPSLGFFQLYHSGLSIGREHIASLVNTLVLAYAGVSFPLLLLYGIQKSQPLWMTINSNFIAEEIVRTLVGSLTLVIAVPLTTMLAAFFYSKK
jgi:uncharacterized membrane protein